MIVLQEITQIILNKSKIACLSVACNIYFQLVTYQHNYW